MRLVADSACDIKELEGMVFKAVPLTISTDNEEFCDDEQLDIHRMLDVLEKHKGRSYTACPGIDAWLEAFDDDNEIFVVTITAGMSGTYNSAMAARAAHLEGRHRPVSVCRRPRGGRDRRGRRPGRERRKARRQSGCPAAELLRRVLLLPQRSRKPVRGVLRGAYAFRRYGSGRLCRVYDRQRQGSV